MFIVPGTLSVVATVAIIGVEALRGYDQTPAYALLGAAVVALLGWLRAFLASGAATKRSARELDDVTHATARVRYLAETAEPFAGEGWKLLATYPTRDELQQAFGAIELWRARWQHSWLVPPGAEESNLIVLDGLKAEFGRAIRRWERLTGNAMFDD
jgi:hypothetical protein